MTPMSLAGPTATSLDPPRVVLRLSSPGTLIYAASGIYTLLFPYLPDSIRYVVAGGIGLVLVGATALPRLAGNRVVLDTRNVFLTVIILTTLVSYAMIMPGKGPLTDYLSSIIRTLTPVGAVIFFSMKGVHVSTRAAFAVYAAVALAATGLTAMYGLYDYAGVMRPQPFTGLDGIHSSAYTVLAALVGTLVLRWRGAISRIQAFLVGTPLFLVFVAYQVRTTWIMILAFLLVVAIARAYRRTDPVRFVAILGLTIGLVWLTVPLLTTIVLPSTDLATLSSGRTNVYFERLAIIYQRPLPVALWGSGLGTDAFSSSTWWWEQKDSHNDFLHIIIEQGIFGFVALLLILGSTMRRVGVYGVAVLAGLIAGAMISNALLERPLLAVLYLGTMALGAGQRPAGQSRAGHGPAANGSAEAAERRRPAVEAP